MSELERSYRAQMETTTARWNKQFISHWVLPPYEPKATSRQALPPGPRVPKIRGLPVLTLKKIDPTSRECECGCGLYVTDNEDIDEAAIAQDAGNQEYLSASNWAWWPFIVAAVVGTMFLLATPYWAIAFLLFIGSALWAFAWVPTVARRKRWMESRGRYYGAVKHIAELEAWHEQNP